MRLKNKIAVIAGAATGIGRASALLFAREGAAVAVGDINDAAGAETIASIRQAGGEGVYVHCDVGVPADVERLVETAVAAYGRLDIIFNNVGIDIVGKVHETSEETWERCININLSGAFRGMKYAIPHMLRGGGGSIISTASIQGLVAFDGYAAYAAAKGAIVQLTRQVAFDYGRHNIRVNCICPGTVLTPMVINQLDPAHMEAGIEAIGQTIPLGRIGQPEDIAAAALYLASDDSRWVTGHALVVDGGTIVKGN